MGVKIFWTTSGQCRSIRLKRLRKPRTSVRMIEIGVGLKEICVPLSPECCRSPCGHSSTHGGIWLYSIPSLEKAAAGLLVWFAATVHAGGPCSSHHTCNSDCTCACHRGARCTELPEPSAGRQLVDGCPGKALDTSVPVTLTQTLGWRPGKLQGWLQGHRGDSTWSADIDPSLRCVAGPHQNLCSTCWIVHTFFLEITSKIQLRLSITGNCQTKIYTNSFILQFSGSRIS